jgi:hypothetical protein
MSSNPGNADHRDRPEESLPREHAEGSEMTMTRRALLTGAGRAAAIGSALSAGSSLVASTPAEAAGDLVAEGAKGLTTLEFVARVEQDGTTLSGVGYLTSVARLDPASLFTDPDARSEATARFTATAAATLISRSVLDNVFVIDAEGALTIRLPDPPGADFAQPDSFATGLVVAVYDFTLQDILTVIAPDRGIPTIAGDLRQRESAVFVLDGHRYRFGRPNLRLRLEATGLGVRTDAAAPRATLTIAGNVVTVGG